MKEIIRWGILGPGTIAHKFATGLQMIPDAKLTAVGSRSRERAENFAAKYHISNVHDSYEELVKDPEVDIIYIATPHPFHKEHAILCMEHGKAVLCEKPFAMNTKEVEEMIQLAREKKVFLMEAMWTRFLPAMVKVRELLKQNKIKEIKMVKADFCFRSDWNPEGRLLNRELGGGAILDVGVYTLSFASMVLGMGHSHISSYGHIGETGVDEQTAMTLAYPKGEMAVLTCAIRTQTPQDAYIVGTEGYIHLPNFWNSSIIHLHMSGRDTETLEIPYESTGYQYEAMEAMNCIRKGKLESDIMLLEESLAITKTMDTVRNQWNLKYNRE